MNRVVVKISNTNCTVLMGNKITFAQSHEWAYRLSEIDETCYGRKRYGPDYILSMYRKNPDTVLFLMDGDEIVGYMTYIPISKESYSKLLNGSTKVIEIKDVLYKVDCVRAGAIYIYITSVMILPEYRDTGVSLLLAFTFKNHIKKYLFQVIGLVADCTSEDGVKYAKCLGLTQYSDSLYITEG